MAGNKEGGIKARNTIKARDREFYVQMGAKGGAAPHTGPRGFAKMTPEQRQAAGAKGGKASRRRSRKAVLPVENQTELDKLAQALQEEAAVISY